MRNYKERDSVAKGQSANAQMIQNINAVKI